MNVHARQPGAEHRVRIEDQALVSGRGRFMDDPLPTGQAYAAFVRSPHAFARIRALDVEAARAAPGVLAVLTAADLAEAGVTHIAQHPPMPGRRGTTLINPPRPVLAEGAVFHIGQPLAVVVADTREAAADGAERVAVDYEEQEPVVDLSRALAPDAPQIWPQAPHNLALTWLMPADEEKIAAVERAVDNARHVARVQVVNQRLVMATMEPRGATGSYDPASGRYTLRACSQGAGALAQALRPVMGLAPEQLRVISEDVGGAFGLKTGVYPEYPVLLVAARRVGRPVHWMSSRSEAFLSDHQARDTITQAALALDDNGRFLALSIHHLGSMGAFLSANGAFIQTSNFARCFPAVYDIPLVGIEVQCAFTNTVPTGPYRGAGRPEANYVIERVIDEAARITGIDRVEIRRRNLIPAAAMPYQTPVGTTYDSGDFAPMFDKALGLANYDGFAARRAEAERGGKLRGLGISCFLEHAGGVPTEGADVAFPGGDRLTMGIAVHSTGQGHKSVFGRLMAERLGVDPDQVEIQQGDSAKGVAGFASVASRSAITVGGVIVKAADLVIEKGRRAASALLEAAESDIEYRDGHFAVVGTDRRMSLFDVAARVRDLVASGTLAEPLDTKTAADTPQTFPNGAHVAEVEIDPATGVVDVISYTAVDDCGVVLDHTIVEGQVHGALAQGLGQVLLENTVYDPGSGQLVSGSFMDYAMPRAHHMPEIREGMHNVPATTNPLGVKGVGEAGTTGSLAAVMNAIADAIPNGRGRALDMPATAEKVWRACNPHRGGDVRL